MLKRLPLFAAALYAALAPAGAQVGGGRLPTRWDKDVSPTAPLPDYPRPQMTRTAWQSLNGRWEYAVADTSATTAPAAFDGKILVPFPYEAALSGREKPSIPDQTLWYRRTFSVPARWKDRRVLLHFGAVNYDSRVSVNGKALGRHVGGYDSFDFDITDALQPGVNTLIVSAQNPLKSDVPDAQVLGKQRVKSGSIFYTAATGIWQSVWLEPVPAAHIATLKMTPDVDASALRLTVNAENAAGMQVKVTATDGRRTVASVVGKPGVELQIPIAKAHLWTPDDPHLYSLKVSLVRNRQVVDSVDSYCALRKISLGKDESGRNRLLLNGKFVFQVGTLDQGYWPDGIYTAPTDAALKYDIEATKKLGFNLIRKHAKVEPQRWYYWTDKLGMLVWQDMPQMFAGRDGALTDGAKAQFETEWRQILAELHNAPSIVVWTTFNEGWGQHDTEKVVALTRQIDPSRLVNNASGWNDKNVGDMRDTHDYPGPGSEMPTETRAAVNGEFGGVTMRVPGHLWTTGAVMGYGSVLSDARLVTKRYQTLLKNGYKLKDERGTSALVYTQITDVEQEINGLLTYDRAVIKPDAAIVAAANRGQFPPLPPDPPAPPPVVASSEDQAQTWRYTTDKPADDWTKSDFNDAAWKSGPGGFGHEVGGARTAWTTPDIWIRRAFTLPADLPAKLAFSVFYDEDAEIYVNGVLAAKTTDYVANYVTLPMSAAGRAALKPGPNTIAVHCRQTIGGQFIDVGIVKAQP